MVTSVLIVLKSVRSTALTKLSPLLTIITMHMSPLSIVLPLLLNIRRLGQQNVPLMFPLLFLFLAVKTLFHLLGLLLLVMWILMVFWCNTWILTLSLRLKLPRSRSFLTIQAISTLDLLSVSPVIHLIWLSILTSSMIKLMPCLLLGIMELNVLLFHILTTIKLLRPLVLSGVILKRLLMESLLTLCISFMANNCLLIEGLLFMLRLLDLVLKMARYCLKPLCVGLLFSICLSLEAVRVLAILPLH